MPDLIKLLIWDLDDTFWRGTLSEGPVAAVAENLALVRDTTSRGLVHTIVSKNDLAPVEAELAALGIREFFVFVRVGWQPKGPVIQELLVAMQLRAANALFLDDNAANRREAAFYNPGLRVADPVEIPVLAPELLALGKPDAGLSRLRQYQLLERQQQARAQYEGDNLAFLRAAGLRVGFREGPAALLPDVARIEELINRSNQLNFTKRRVSVEELTASFADASRRWGTVRVRDQFGDYGLVGVFCVDLKANALAQFVFSCRILHLGIEQFAYAWLGFPALEVQGEVLTELSPTARPDWLEIEEAADAETTGASGAADTLVGFAGPGRAVAAAVTTGVSGVPTAAPATDATTAARLTTPAAPRLRVFLKGGCDLGQLTPYLRAFDLAVEEEFNFLNENQLTAHLEHTALLRHTRELPAADRQRLAQLPFLGREAFDTRLWAENQYDVLVFSPLMDYTQDLYREKSTGLAVPFGGYQNLLLLAPEALAARYARRKFRGLDANFWRQFGADFAFEGPVSPARFAENLGWLRQQIPVAVPIFFLNGTEITVTGAAETGAAARHAVLNAALAAFVAGAENCFLLDVRPFINQPADVTNNLRHYQPRHYRTLAHHLAQAIASGRGQQLTRSRWADWRARAWHWLPEKVRHGATRVFG